MNIHTIFLLALFFICSPFNAHAQTDKWTGTWRMEAKPWPGLPAISLELQIGNPGQQTLYPALMKLNYGTFSGTYELLLATKNAAQLGIGRGKYPIQETPFKLGAWMLYLNGTFDYIQHNNAPASMKLSRMWIDAFGLFMKGLYDDDEIYVNTKVRLRSFLYQDSIQLKKINNQPWTDAHTYRILHPEEDSIYFGMYDKIIVEDSIIHLSIRDDDQLDKDTVTLVHNGRVLLNRMEMNDQTREQSLHLDTGMNILTFFADNYGGLPPNTGNLRVTAADKKYAFDFADHSNRYATFLVAQFYRKTGIIPPGKPDTAQRSNRVIIRKEEQITTFTVKQADIVLELWDALQEDGDSISLRLNNTWVVNGWPVKKEVQQLKIKLQPGENRLLFMADNLGSIPPNTAVLRIRFGNETKILELKTDLQRSNVVRIVYEPATL